MLNNHIKFINFQIQIYTIQMIEFMQFIKDKICKICIDKIIFIKSL
jgi:hypothetical protein